MGRPAKARETYDREFAQIVRLRKVVKEDTIAKPLWKQSVDERLRELLVLFMSEDGRRRAK